MAKNLKTDKQKAHYCESQQDKVQKEQGNSPRKAVLKSERATMNNEENSKEAAELERSGARERKLQVARDPVREGPTTSEGLKRRQETPTRTEVKKKKNYQGGPVGDWSWNPP